MDEFRKIEKVLPEEVPEIPREQKAQALRAEAQVVNNALQNFFAKNPEGVQNGKAIMKIFEGLPPDALKAIRDLIPAMILGAEDK